MPEGYPSWRPVITTDCGANIKKALDDPGGHSFWIKCALHVLHNSVKAGLAGSGQGGPIFKIKKLTSHFRRSEKCRWKLRVIQEQVWEGMSIE